MPADLHDNTYSTNNGNYYLSSPFARAKYSLNGCTTMQVYGYTNLDTYNQLGVSKDGVMSVLDCGGAGHNTWDVDVTGARNVEVIASAEGKLITTVSGTFINAIRFIGGVATKIPPTAPASRVLIYGDSIANGWVTTSPVSQAWTMLLRAHIPVIVDGWGGRTMKENTSTEELRTALASLFATASPSIVWISIGYNDYKNSSWSAADFGTAYADLLDKINAALPSATIYAQTPIIASNEAANGLGDTLGAYRTVIGTAQSTRTAFCNLVDGSAILESGDLYDGIHPSTAGHAKYAAAVKTVLGL